MSFSAEFLDELRARVPIAKFIRRRVPLVMVKRGREWGGLCPFHSEDTPSFTVNRRKKNSFFHCFGCGAHGDVISFVMHTEGLGFPEAVKKLASEAGLKLPPAAPLAGAMPA
jgi:DNA primase